MISFFLFLFIIEDGIRHNLTSGLDIMKKEKEKKKSDDDQNLSHNLPSIEIEYISIANLKSLQEIVLGQDVNEKVG